ncbi:hypothetical protein F5051DRAFT_444780 [Lentinula edodes]|nr:hypothetical protein F5051DRAFT_444780 [Lentinula edodes]
MPPVEHFAALIEFNDPNSTTCFVLPSLTPVVLPKPVELSDEQVVKAAPPNDTIRTLILEPTVLAHDQSNPTTGSMVPPNQQHHRASIGNTMDLYGASIANFLNTAFPIPVAPPDGEPYRKGGSQPEPVSNKAPAMDPDIKQYGDLPGLEMKRNSLKTLDQDGDHEEDVQVHHEPQSISSALRIQRQARRQSPYLIRPKRPLEDSERQSSIIETDSHGSQHIGFVPSERGYAAPQYRQEKVRLKDVTTSWYTYRTLGPLASPPDLPYPHSGLKHNDIFLHINEARRLELNGSMQFRQVLKKEMDLLADIHSAQQYAQDAWHEETGRRTDYMCRLCHSTEEEQKALSQLASDTNKFLLYVDSILEAYRGTFASLHQKCRSSGNRLAQEVTQNASILCEVISKSYQLQEQLLEDTFLRKSLIEEVELAHSKKISPPKARMKENGTQVIFMMTRYQEVLKVLAANLNIDTSSRYSIQPSVIRRQVSEVSASCASTSSIERQMEWSVSDPRISQPRTLEKLEWGQSEEESERILVDVKEEEDLTLRFFEMKQEKLRMVLNSVENLRVDGQKLVSQVEKSIERLQVLRESHRERLDVLNDYAENMIERTEQKLNILQKKSPARTTDNILEFGQAHTTEYLGELWTIALRVLTLRATKDARKMQSKKKIVLIGANFVKPCPTKRSQPKPDSNGRPGGLSMSQAIRDPLVISVHTLIEETVRSSSDPAETFTECTTSTEALDLNSDLSSDFLSTLPSTFSLPPLIVRNTEVLTHPSQCVVLPTPESANKEAEGSLEFADQRSEESYVGVALLKDVAYSWTTLISSVDTPKFWLDVYIVNCDIFTYRFVSRGL